MFRRRTFLSVVAGSAAVALAMPARAAVPLDVVTSFSILGDMVKEVGGDRVAVTTLVGPDSDTHVYEPTPADAKALAGAGLIFVNGLGFEGWMPRLIEASGYKGTVVEASEGVKTRTMDEDGASITDPHAWQSLPNGELYVANIVTGLSKADPAGAATYEASGERYTAQLAALDARIRSEIATVTEARRKVITTHDAFGYFGATYGITFIAPVGASTESEASAGDVARIVRQMKKEGTTALFLENMSDPRLLEQIARETGAAVGGTLYSDALSPSDGSGATYVAMFENNVPKLVAAMNGRTN